jgi:hypothetical protein
MRPAWCQNSAIRCELEIRIRQAKVMSSKAELVQGVCSTTRRHRSPRYARPQQAWRHLAQGYRSAARRACTVTACGSTSRRSRHAWPASSPSSRSGTGSRPSSSHARPGWQTRRPPHDVGQPCVTLPVPESATTCRSKRSDLIHGLACTSPQASPAMPQRGTMERAHSELRAFGVPGHVRPAASAALSILTPQQRGHP